MTRFLTVVFALLLTMSSFGAVVNIDCGVGLFAQGETAVAPDSGTNWNSVWTGNSWTEWRNSDGTPTNVRVTQTSGSDGNLGGGAPYTGLLSDYTWVTGSGTANWTISGLTAPAYDLYVYSVVSVTPNQSGRFSVDGFASQLLCTNSSWTDNVTTFQEGVNYVVFRNVAPDTMGNVFLSMKRNGAEDWAGCNGFQIVEVPEPATMSLLALGGLALIRRRK